MDYIRRFYNWWYQNNISEPILITVDSKQEHIKKNIDKYFINNNLSQDWSVSYINPITDEITINSPLGFFTIKTDDVCCIIKFPSGLHIKILRIDSLTFIYEHSNSSYKPISRSKDICRNLSNMCIYRLLFNSNYYARIILKIANASLI